MADLPHDPVSLPHLNEKDRKADILVAYQALLKKYEEKSMQPTGKEREMRQSKEEAIIRHASGYTLEKVLQGCRNLEAAIHTHLHEVADTLGTETRRLKEVQEAISLEERRLEEVHEIKIVAVALGDLIETYRKKERELQVAYERKVSELENEIRKKKDVWVHEQEEQQYFLAQQKKREELEREERKAQFEQELAVRMGLLRKELVKDQEKAIQDAQRDSEKKIRQEEQTKAELRAQETLREKEIAQLKIASFNHQLEFQAKELDSLRKQLHSASQEAKEIALRVIEGTATAMSLRTMQRVGEEKHVAA